MTTMSSGPPPVPVDDVDKGIDPTPAPPTASPPAPARSIPENNARLLRLRRRLLLFSLPVILAITVVAIWLLSLSATAGLAIQQYNRASYTESASTAGGLLSQNHVEKWLPYFDRGVALAGGEEYIPAIDDFEIALLHAPESRRCQVIVNLSLGWERLADGYAQAGLFDGAALLYQTSLDVLEGQDCVPPEEPVDGRDPGQELQDAEARVQAKLDASQFFSEEGGEEEPTTSEERLEQLNEQGEDAAEEKADGDSRDRAEQGTGGFAEKPW